jgi:hypothetical protein
LAVELRWIFPCESRAHAEHFTDDVCFGRWLSVFFGSATAWDLLLVEECVLGMVEERELLRPYAGGKRRSASSTAADAVQFIFISADYIGGTSLNNRVQTYVW